MGFNIDGYIRGLERILTQDPSRTEIDYLLRGLRMQNEGFMLESIEMFRRSLRQFNKHGNLEALVLCYGYIAISLDHVNQPYKAVKYYQKACKTAEVTKNIELTRLSCSSLAAAYDRIGKASKSIAAYERAVIFAISLHDRFNEALCYFGIAIVYSSKNQYRKSIENEQRALDIFRELGDLQRQIHCFVNIGMSLNMLKEHEQALQYYNLALTAISNCSAERDYLKDVYFGIGISNDGLLKYKKACRYYKKSLAIAEKMKDIQTQGRCCALLDTAYFNLGYHRKSIYYSKQVLLIAQENRDDKTQVDYCINIAEDYHRIGRNEKSLDYFRKAIGLLQNMQQDEKMVQCLTEIGICHYTMGEYRKSINYNLHALKIAKKLSNEARQIICCINLGEIYHLLGDYKKSICFFERLLTFRSTLVDRITKTRLFLSLAFMHYIQKKTLQSEKYQKRSVNMIRKLEESKILAQLYLKLGTLKFFLDSYKTAIRYFMSALRIATKFKDKDNEAIAYVCLGSSYGKMGNIHLSRKFHNDGLGLAREMKNVTLESVINLNLGKINFLTNPLKSYRYLEKFIRLNEKFGKELVEEEQKIMFFGSISEAYELIICLCLKLNYVKKGFEFVERAKGRAFLDLISKGNLNVVPKNTSEIVKPLLNQEQICLSKLKNYQISGLNQNLATANRTDDVDKLLSVLHSIYKKIRKFDPEYVSLRTAAPMSLDQTVRMISNHDNTILIEYFIARNEIIIFLLHKHKLTVKTVPCFRGQVVHMVRKFRELITTEQDLSEAWSWLSNKLIQPLSEFISRNVIVRFIPHHVLHYLPLHALKLNDTPLILKNPVVYSPSSSILQFVRNRNKEYSNQCIVYGIQKDSSDKEIVIEARNIARLYKTNAYINVPKSFVSRNISSALLHFSCHGYFDYKDPLSSGIMLKDSILTAREMLNGEILLDSNMVTVSACESGVNETTQGDEFIGFTRALLYSGTSSIVASLWEVETLSTMKLMMEFYKNIKKMKDKAMSLQRAQVKLMEEKEYSHPFYWAPFILIGNHYNLQRP